MNKEIFEGVISLAQNVAEKQKIIDFIENANNNDFLEQALLYSSGYHGWATLSSGATVYISPPQISPEEVGNAIKLFTHRLKERNSDTDKNMYNEELSLQDRLNELSEQFKGSLYVTYSIDDLKKRIKYSKNPLEIKMLNKELNILYKQFK